MDLVAKKKTKYLSVLSKNAYHIHFNSLIFYKCEQIVMNDRRTEFLCKIVALAISPPCVCVLASLST